LPTDDHTTDDGLHDGSAADRHRTLHAGPPSALARNVVVGLLIAFVVASNLGNLFLSVLVTERPLLFIGLNAQNRNLALAAGELDAVSFYVVGFLRLVGPDPLFFLLGRWYGDSAIRWMERRAPSYGELLRMLEAWFDKARLLVVAVAPNNPVCLFAGAAGMTWGAFMLANVIGTVVRLVLVRLFSSAFENQLGSLRDFIGEYRWPLLAVSFLAVGFTIWNDHRAGREDIGDLLNMEEDIAQDEAGRADASAPGATLAGGEETLD
jgi:membrane protein DedA with SNARE-associated domain